MYLFNQILVLVLKYNQLVYIQVYLLLKFKQKIVLDRMDQLMLQFLMLI